MSGSRRLKCGAVRLLARSDGPDGRLYTRTYTALDQEFGLKSEMLRMEGSRVALTWLNLIRASQALDAARRARERGKGRRPSAQAVERLARRQGLADQSYAAAIEKLRELTSKNGHGPLDPAELIAAMRAERDG